MNRKISINRNISINREDKSDRGKPMDLKKGYLLLLIGIFVASLGVAFAAKAGLGTSPVSSVPLTRSMLCPFLSFWAWMTALSLAQILIQKGRSDRGQIAVQIGIAFVFGYFIDFSGWLIRGLGADRYPVQFLHMLAGCFLLALGIWIQLKGGVAMLPGEAMNRAISGVSGIKHGNVKIITDVLYIAAAAVISLVFLGGLKGVREGSIINAVLTGNIIKLYERIWRRIRA